MKAHALRRIWTNLDAAQRAGLIAMVEHHRGAAQPTLPTAVHKVLLARGLVEMETGVGRRISEKGLAVAEQAMEAVW